MPGSDVYWTLVFTAASLEHLGERNIEAVDVADAVYGRHGPARVRGAGRGGGAALVRDRPAWHRRIPDVRIPDSAPTGPGGGGRVPLVSHRATGTGWQGRFIDAPLRQRARVRRGRGEELSPMAGRQGRPLGHADGSCEEG